ncbi:unnamed protein product [Triticum turgidum subsp. durum]|uniref:C3H1-type domain-containing protein n=1 Tax=Triticum turgidum subsp. durum TaxID=4567 RepID=A0A9R0YB70_TRITD|nr:unnamed protein product [Triticum turgidum subsp. durum]
MDSAAAQAQPTHAPADEEEARRRRGTDCVYYLASPLTCNKGSECEYRHSDGARVNPRDCWYWFNGNCANAKCSFRHPPLDDLLGASATPRAPQQPALQVPVPAQAVPPNGTAKPVVPCYYYQKGMCAKGNLCTFSHGPQFAGNHALQPHLQLKNSNSWTKPTNSPQQSTTPAVHGELKVGAQNGRPAQKQNPTSRAYHSPGIYQNQNKPYVLSGAAKSYQPQRSVEAESAENVMETGEFVREPSAGSSVVAGSVEDDAERSFKEGHTSSYRRASGEQNSGVRRQAHGGYELERSSHRSSSDRLVSERRLTQRESMPVTAESSDLRHRLLKQRRLNDSRQSTQVPDRRDRRYPEDERDSHHRRRGEERAAHDGLSRSRLQGRIKLPGETSLDRLGPHPHLEKERGHRDRLSPPKQTDLRAKLHDRLKARSNEEVPGNLKSSVVKASSGEDAGVVNFSGPKSLAELRAKKAAYRSGENTVKNAGRVARPARMTSEIVAKRDSPDLVPFDGPKPLSVILKRKREAASADSGSMQEEQVAGQEEQSLNNSRILDNDRVEANTEDIEEEEEFHPEDDVMYDDDGLSPADDNTAEAAADVGKEELEEGQQEDLETAAEEEYDYQAADDANAEGENDYQEYEDDDDLEDDDDFARKVGVLIS